MLLVGSCLAESHLFVCVLIDDYILLTLTHAINGENYNAPFHNLQ
jgi:hypothetical protein